jgi:hypothetical protein
MKLKTAPTLALSSPFRVANFYPIFLTPRATPANLGIKRPLVDAHHQYPIILALAVCAIQLAQVV